MMMMTGRWVEEIELNVMLAVGNYAYGLWTLNGEADDDDVNRWTQVVMMMMFQVENWTQVLMMMMLQVENWTQVLKDNGNMWPEDPDPAWNTTKCLHGWNYDRCKGYTCNTQWILSPTFP